MLNSEAPLLRIRIHSTGGDGCYVQGKRDPTGVAHAATLRNTLLARKPNDIVCADFTEQCSAADGGKGLCFAQDERSSANQRSSVGFTACAVFPKQPVTRA